MKTVEGVVFWKIMESEILLSAHRGISFADTDKQS